MQPSNFNCQTLGPPRIGGCATQPYGSSILQAGLGKLPGRWPSILLTAVSASRRSSSVANALPIQPKTTDFHQPTKGNAVTDLTFGNSKKLRSEVVADVARLQVIAPKVP